MTYDPAEFMDEESYNDFAVRQHLWAQRRLADSEVDTKAKVAKMLAEVTPGRKVCSMFVTTGGLEGEKAKRSICGKPGTRLLRLTGDWTCTEHDPLAGPYWGEPCCTREDIE